MTESNNDSIRGFVIGAISCFIMSALLIFLLRLHWQHRDYVYELTHESERCHATCRKLHMHNYLACLYVDEQLTREEWRLF